jgi:hypothetical protein
LRFLRNENYDCVRPGDTLSYGVEYSGFVRHSRVHAMKRIGLFIAFLTIVGLLVPAMVAQDAKKVKDGDKTDKKDEKTDPEKKDEKKDEKKKKEKFVYGHKFTTKVLSIKPDSSREFTVEVQELDQKKVADVNIWSTQRTQQLALQYTQQVLQQKDANARAQALVRYNNDMVNYKIELAKRQTQVYTAKNLEVRGGENAKLRSNLPPVEFDDAGNPKKFTKKELEERKDKSGLPGLYPGEFDLLKAGQYVELYMVKQAPAKKEATPKKKNPDDVDPLPMTMQGQEYILVVIIGTGKQ